MQEKSIPFIIIVLIIINFMYHIFLVGVKYNIASHKPCIRLKLGIM